MGKGQLKMEGGGEERERMEGKGGEKEREREREGGVGGRYIKKDRT